MYQICISKLTQLSTVQPDINRIMNKTEPPINQPDINKIMNKTEPPINQPDINRIMNKSELHINQPTDSEYSETCLNQTLDKPECCIN